MRQACKKSTLRTYLCTCIHFSESVELFSDDDDDIGEDETLSEEEGTGNLFFKHKA